MESDSTLLLNSSQAQQDDLEPEAPFNIEQALSQSNYEEGEQAINLITYDPKEGFQVSPQAIELLKGVKEKIGIIAVAGKYRTGKSFLLNRIILDKKEKAGFGVGPTINPCTKGLWIWNKPIEVTSNPGEAPFKCFIIDSEGIGAFNEDQNHDTRIFLLALLLSSYFVYNSMGTIDENALQNLSLIVNLSKQLQIKNHKAEEADPEEVASYFPSFMWVVRDFALKLLDTCGNTINSKEYLESALKEQKGTSDNVEKKNRIRRLILNFFRDRDCFTMVRPTEEEKDLQCLQNLQDEDLRPEFLSQMTNLRQRIFKRVKPKSLNGKFITGELFIELCQAYTAAINKGSIPCIESAWTYLCQNENQRGIQESIQVYDDQMRKNIFLNSSRSDCVDYTSFKNLHKKLRDESIQYFKEKVLGDNLSDFQNKILEEIQKKYTQFKQKCLQIYDIKCNQSIKKEIDEIDLKIRQDKYTTIQDFQQDLDKLKQTYSQATSSIIYTHKDLVLKNISEKLIIKAFDEITRREKELLSNSNRTLKEQVNFLEKDITTKKQDYEQERVIQSQKFFEAQNEIQQVRANSKLLEERNKMYESEKIRIETQLQEKLKVATEQNEKIETELRGQVKEYQKKIKELEGVNIKYSSSYEKDMALLQQKQQYTEKENEQLQSKLTQLAEDSRTHLEKFQMLDSQNRILESQLKEKENERKNDLQSLKEQYEMKLSEIKNSDTEVSQEKQKLWEKEKQFMQEQLLFSQKQVEENKKMHEIVLQTLNQKSTNKNQDQQILMTNKTLSETIAKVEQKNQQLATKVSSIKIYQRVFKHSQSMQCKFCQVFFPSEIFIDHVKSCNKDNRYSRSIFFQIPLSISIIQTLIKEDPQDSRTYTEYAVHINFNNKTWTMNQKYKTFCSLHERLINQYPNIKFPQSSFQFATKGVQEIGNQRGKGQGGMGTMIEDRRKILQQYLQDLALIPAIKESLQFKQFIGIQEHFPEFWDDHAGSSQNLLGNEDKSRHGLPSAPPSFKIMNDLFMNKKQPSVDYQPKQQPSQKPSIEKPQFTGSAKTLQKNRYATLSSVTTPSKAEKTIEESRRESKNDELRVRVNQLEDDDFCVQENSNEKTNSQRYSLGGQGKISLSAKKNVQDGMDEFSKNLYLKELGKNKCSDITNSLSYNNMMYSPSQADHSIMDRGYQPQKENCVACQSKNKIEQEFFRESCEELPSMISQGRKDNEVSSSYQNLALLGELVRKSQQKVNNLAGGSGRTRSDYIQKKDSTSRSKDNVSNYMNQMKSDKFYSELISREKSGNTSMVNNTKNATPSKKPLIHTNQRSPYVSINPASNSNTPLSLATTPDQLKRGVTFDYMNAQQKNAGPQHGVLMQQEKKGYIRSSEKLRHSKK